MISITNEQIDRIQSELSRVPVDSKKALVRAINKSLRKIRMEMIRSTRKNYHTDNKRIMATLKIKNARANKLESMIESRGRPLPLSYFKVRYKSAGKNKGSYLHAKVRKDGGGYIRYAFGAVMKSGHVGIFARKDINNSRSKIKQLYSPSVPEMLGHKSVEKLYEDKAAKIIDQCVEAEINKALGGNA